MSHRIRIDTDATGQPITRKHADTADAARVRHEARALEAARHPGVVELAEHVEHPDGSCELATRWVGSHSLETWPCRSAAHVAGLVAALATTVADLHDLGISHGALTADHVLIRHDGRPVLCGLAEARLEDSPAASDRFASDVAALGELVHRLLGEDADDDPIPDRRIRPFVARRRWPRYQRRALRTLADQAVIEHPGRRPTARMLAAAIREAIPDADLVRPDEHDTTDRGPVASAERLSRDAATGSTGSEETAPEGLAPEGLASEDPPPGLDGWSDPLDLDHLRPSDLDDPRPTPAPRRLIAASCVLALLAGACVLGWRILLGSSPATPPEAALREPPPIEAPSDADPETAPDAGPGCPRREPERLALTDASVAAVTDIDGDGCTDVVEVAGSVLSGDGRRWRIGEEGDVVHLGDWDCDGVSTPAVLRPDTGELFVFDRWASPGEQISIPPVRAFDDPVGLDAVSDHDAECPGLLVEHADGTTSAVAPEQAS